MSVNLLKLRVINLFYTDMLILCPLVAISVHIDFLIGMLIIFLCLYNLDSSD